MMIKESELNITEWKEIPKWNEYRISEKGEIYSVRRKRMMKVYTPEKGYPRITLSQDGKERSFCIHRLVALAYIPNPENKITVNHKDGNKNNNHVSNLEWCTYSENQKHAIQTGLATVPLLEAGENHPKSKLNNVDVAMIRVLLNNDFTCEQIANRFNVHPSYISAIRTSKRRIAI